VGLGGADFYLGLGYFREESTNLPLHFLKNIILKPVGAEAPTARMK